ncbi:MAG: DUF1615 family protein [Dokdonella sp.]|nr:DUF1615 family protein [Dokdonella sp.]
MGSRYPVLVSRCWIFLRVPKNLCAALAVIAQESTFVADPVVPDLGQIARKESEHRAAQHHDPAPLPWALRSTGELARWAAPATRIALPACAASASSARNLRRPD